MAGASITAIGLFWLGQTPTTNHYGTQLLPALILTTFGLGLSLVPMTVAATAGVAPHEAGLAAGLLNTSRQIGGAIGLAALATIAANRASSARRATAPPLPHALTLGYDRAHLVNAGIAVVAVLVALTLPRRVRPEARRGSRRRRRRPTSRRPNPAVAAER